MRNFLADLHIHTGLSPCAAEEMTPPAIVQAAIDVGLELIAICDHNSAGNVAATQAAAGSRLAVLAGLEITTAEEVHVVGLFPSARAAVAIADEIGATLPTADFAYYHRFGPQQQMDANGRVVGMELRMLAAATSLALAAVVDLVHRQGGLAIAAHVNRPSFSVVSQLGMFPANAPFDGLEVFTPVGGGTRPTQSALGGAPANLPVLASSDAHYLGDIGRARTICTMHEPSFDELVLALRGADSREVRCA